MTRARAREFLLIPWQDKLIAKLVDIHTNGVGGHKARSTGRVCSSARRFLETMGWSCRDVDNIVRACKDMARLELNANE